MKKLFSLALLFAVILVGCKKDDDVKVDVKAQLTAATKGWVIESIKITGDPTNTNIVDSYEACEKDDSYIFAAAGTFTVANNELKCDNDEDPVSTGTWSLNADQTELTVIEGGDTTVIKKLVITETTITGEFSEGGSTATISFKKKS